MISLSITERKGQMTKVTDKCPNRQLFTDTKRVTCDLSSVGNQEGKSQMTQGTVKCPHRRLYTDISAYYMRSLLG